MDSLSYRPLLLKDLDAVQQLYLQALDAARDALAKVRVNEKLFAHTMRQMRQELLAQQRYLAWVAEADGQILGYIAAVIETQASLFEVSRYANINEIFILPEYRRRGVGTGLVNCLQSQVDALGLEWLCVQFPKSAQGLENFFNKLTFESQAIEMRKRLGA
ncbi:MAG: GNAT family N-acetyltransferase [Bradymonadales bacterium]|jgi:GNAT superfamily N-acetyltransferase